MLYLVKTAKISFYKRNFEQNRGKVGKCWKLLNNIAGKNNYKNRDIVLNINGSEESELNTVVNVFNEYFVNVANNIEQSIPRSNLSHMY